MRGVSVVRRAPCTMDPGAQLLWPPRASASEVELSTNLYKVQNFTVHIDTEGPFRDLLLVESAFTVNQLEKLEAAKAA